MTEAELLNIAKNQMKNAYCPYSKVMVGAALLTKNGSVYVGSNIENASFGATMCAERVAVAKAVSAGDTELSAIAIASNIRGITPCGICRQVLYEFSPDMMIIMEDKKEGSIIKTSLCSLLPSGFTL